MKRFLKRLTALLPDRFQNRLRRVHFRRKLSAARLTDEPDLAVIPMLTKKGDVVFDVGANFGLFTRFLSESVGQGGKVYSFEPTSDMFGVLDGNCRALGLDNTVRVRTALSDQTGKAEMNIPQREDGSLNHYEASLGGAVDEGRSESVATSTLDDFCAHHGIERVDFIKCDVEGHELEVLSGARRTLLHHRPSLLLEVNVPLDGGGHGSAVLEMVRSLDYEVHTLTGQGLHPWQPGEVAVNYVLKPKA